MSEKLSNQGELFTFRDALEGLQPQQIYELIKDAVERMQELENIIETAKDVLYGYGVEYEDLVIGEAL